MARVDRNWSISLTAEATALMLGYLTVSDGSIYCLIINRAAVIHFLPYHYQSCSKFGTNAEILIFMLVQASLIWGFYLSILQFSSSDTQNIAFTKIVTTFCLPPVPITNHHIMPILDVKLRYASYFSYLIEDITDSKWSTSGLYKWRKAHAV